MTTNRSRLAAIVGALLLSGVLVACGQDASSSSASASVPASPPPVYNVPAKFQYYQTDQGISLVYAGCDGGTRVYVTVDMSRIEAVPNSDECR